MQETDSDPRVERRRGVPALTFPPDLPISARRGEIAEAIMRHSVVIVCGETGSGKSTQLPKICLGLGRGIAGMIGHTQPRRLAARTIAARIAEELGSALGGAVGYKVRFQDCTGPGCQVKVMTDGILLEEIRADRNLGAYDTLIIDEAHERTLNIDLLLGLARGLVDRRADFRLIVTSATLDPQRFSAFFGGAPIIEVSGRAWPVEIRYRPGALAEAEAAAGGQQEAILSAIEELRQAGPGDCLVFLPSERAIRDVAAYLSKRNLPNFDLLPLYGRLDQAGQDRVFAAHGRAHVVLATNVAETSLTVPGIRCVIDTGLARTSRYNPRSKIQRLPIERISRASADQRSGRCGRLGAGVCIRLYSGEDYAARPAFTEPEIRRTNLAAVILRLIAYRLGDIETFPFIDPPESRFINDGFRLLEELEAVDRRRALTGIGEEMSRLPVDPRIARMLLAARDHGSLAEVLTIAAGLSVQDLRERPAGARAEADRAHARFADQRSDFLWYLNLWKALFPSRRKPAPGRLRRFCRTHFLARARIIEWRDTREQLEALVRDRGFPVNVEPAGYKAIHVALLAGLLGLIATREGNRTYTGARGVGLRIFPGSALRNYPPKWIVAGEITETSRIYARTVARISPAWIVPLAGDLLVRTVFDARWDPVRGRVTACERLTLYGLTLVSARRIDFGVCDPGAAREIFIRSALVDGEFESDAGFLRHNRRLVEELEALEHRARRHDILVSEEVRFGYYLQQIPGHVCCRASFTRWFQGLDPAAERELRWDRAMVLRPGARAIARESYPAALQVSGMQLPMHYHFEPGDERDGVTVDLPLLALNQIDGRAFEWLVPGLLEEKIEALLRGLPKPLRRGLAPIGPCAAAAARALDAGRGGLCDRLTAYVRESAGVHVRREDWNPGLLPEHLSLRLRIIDAQGEVVAAGRDFDALRARLRRRADQVFNHEVVWSIERQGLTRWSFGELPETVRIELAGHPITGYPALVDGGDSVNLAVLDTRPRARRETLRGLRRLVRLEVPAQVKYLAEHLPGIGELCLLFTTVGPVQALREDLVNAVIDRAFLSDPDSIRSQQAFAAACDYGRARMMETAEAVCDLAGRILKPRHEIARRIDGINRTAREVALADIERQVARLVRPGFLTATPPETLSHLPRYLEAVKRRLDRLEISPGRDRAKWAEIAPLEERLAHQLEQLDDAPPALRQLRWMLEEFRVSLFAQELGTAAPVSRQRLDRLLESLHAQAGPADSR